MQTHFFKTLRKTGVLETGALLGVLMLYGSCLGVVHAHPRVTPSEAIEDGNHQMLGMLLDEGCDPNMTDANGTPLLMQAVLYADARMVKLLLDRGADPNAANPAGATALIWAAGDPAKSSLLIQAGADVNARSALGRTPLLVAAATDGAGPVVEQLLALGADRSARDELKGNPKLMTGGGGAPLIVEAAKARDGEALRVLLAEGALDPSFDLNAADANGGTALTESVILGHHENLRILLAAGASIGTTVGMDRYTPLMLAAMRGDAYATALLLDAGADVRATDAVGNTALTWAAYLAESGPSMTVDLLLDAGADPTVANRRGETPLTVAKWHGKTHTYHQLLRSTPAGH